MPRGAAHAVKPKAGCSAALRPDVTGRFPWLPEGSGRRASRSDSTAARVEQRAGWKN